MKKNVDLTENIAFQFQLIHSFFITTNKTEHAFIGVHLLSFTHTFALEQMKSLHTELRWIFLVQQIPIVTTNTFKSSPMPLQK